MQRLGFLIMGFAFGFAIVALSIAAIVLFGVGAGGHVLAVRDDGAARVISFDPSTVAARAPFPAFLAIILMTVCGAVYLRIGRQRNRRPRASLG